AGAGLAVHTENDAILDMRDPLSGDHAQINTVQVIKSGAGVWKLGGDNDFSGVEGSSTKFTVAAGKLYLYGEGEAANQNANDEEARVGAGTLNLPGADSSFVLGAATLQAGGQNDVTTEGSMGIQSGAIVDAGPDSMTL